MKHDDLEDVLFRLDMIVALGRKAIIYSELRGLQVPLVEYVFDEDLDEWAKELYDILKSRLHSSDKLSSYVKGMYGSNFILIDNIVIKDDTTFYMFKINLLRKMMERIPCYEGSFKERYVKCLW